MLWRCIYIDATTIKIDVFLDALLWYKDFRFDMSAMIMATAWLISVVALFILIREATLYYVRKSF